MFKFKMVHWVIDTSELSTKPKLLVKTSKSQGGTSLCLECEKPGSFQTGTRQRKC